ncbi:hypothetical protein Cni_G16371 [Canna indica]|uniref:Uncharacterized protein n=1 Tax=Canna indica TaxID=4628 RepID=A0AAQ3QCI1_9LILI|nr:hypothetical protein Cni_G16371 [Canna indica]
MRTLLPFSSTAPIASAVVATIVVRSFLPRPVRSSSFRGLRRRRPRCLLIRTFGNGGALHGITRSGINSRSRDALSCFPLWCSP